MNISASYSSYQSSMVKEAFSIESIKNSSEMASQTIDTLMSGVSQIVMASRPGIGGSIDTYA